MHFLSYRSGLLRMINVSEKIVTLVALTRLIVTLYVHCLSRYGIHRTVPYISLQEQLTEYRQQ